MVILAGEEAILQIAKFQRFLPNIKLGPRIAPIKQLYTAMYFHSNYASRSISAETDIVFAPFSKKNMHLTFQMHICHIHVGESFKVWRCHNTAVSVDVGIGSGVHQLFGSLLGSGPSADKDLNDAGDWNRQNHAHQAEVESADTDSQQNEQRMQTCG